MWIQGHCCPLAMEKEEEEVEKKRRGIEGKNEGESEYNEIKKRLCCKRSDRT